MGKFLSNATLSNPHIDFPLNEVNSTFIIFIIKKHLECGLLILSSCRITTFFAGILLLLC